MDKKIKIIWILRIILLIMLAAFWFIFSSATKTNCEVCSFEIGEEEYNIDKFFSMYHGECLVKNTFITDAKVIEMLKNQSG